MNKISILSFAKQAIPYIFNPNQKYIKWGCKDEIPENLLNLYNEVPEHSSSINFILNNLVKDGIEQIDFWTLQKLALDYLIFGGFSVEKIKQRGGDYIYKYLDITKCRLSGDKQSVGYSDNWNSLKVDIVWKSVITDSKGDGIFIFKNPKSRGDYPTPHYQSSLKSLDTMYHISEYHNNNAKNGFTPNVIINFNNGEPDEDTKANIERQVEDKFTGANGQKFILSFNDSEQTKTTIEKLDNDNLDQKFETLQKFIQNQIIIGHQITSGQLIGVKPENQGFSKTEYSEAMEIFEETIISTYRKEMEYGLSLLLDKPVVLTATNTIGTDAKENTNTIN